ncbi:MAG: putative toxin-antitoxin system toxin component, PIN family [Chloroflexi bacterium]|nr:putative toxin-antitoxin system toxin component, PIN family [Chloroflexota bacterium]
MTKFVTAVFDTNILVRLRLAKSKAIRKLWDALLAGEFELITSESILAELDRVLHYPRIFDSNRLSDESVAEFIDTLRRKAVLIEELYEVWRVDEDETDNMFLAAALETYADYLVSEDKHLRAIKYYHGVQIVGLAQFQKEIGL